MTYASAVLGDSPTVFWQMQETSGTVMTDSSGNAHHGTYVNSPTLNQASLVPGDATAKSVTFSGVNDSTSFVDTTITRANNWTVSGWVRPDLSTYSEGQFWGTDYDGSEVNQSLRVNGSKFISAYFASGSWRETPAPSNFASGTVYHVANTWDGTNLRLYIDGTLVATTTPGVARGTGTISTFYISNKWDAGNRTKMGASHVALWPTALSGAQINAHYLAGGGSVPPTASLTQSSSLSATGVRGKAGTAAFTQTSVLTSVGTVSGPPTVHMTQTSTLTAAATVFTPTNVPLGPWVADLSRTGGFALDVTIGLSVEEADDPAEASSVIVRQRFSEEYPDPVLVDGRPT